MSELEHAVFRETKTTFNLMSFDDDKTALILLINQATSTISIYSHSLCAAIFDTPSVVSACEKFCLKNHRTVINILVNETRPVTRISHRLLSLSHRHSSSIFFKKTNPVVPSREDDFVCFDKSAYFKLTNHEHYHATCNFSNADHTARFLAFFNGAWARSEPDTEFCSITL